MFSVVPKVAGVKITNDVPDDLPVPSLDKDQFRQVLVNLVQNGVEATAGKEGAEVIVRAAGGQGGEPWRIEIADNGNGIPSDVLPKIFEPLYTTKVKGTGLGLAVVSNMVAAHGGTIVAESDPGKGTRFTITLGHGEASARENLARSATVAAE